MSAQNAAAVRYAGFWPRLLAIVVDMVVMAPLIALSFWTFSASRTTALALEVPLALAFGLYSIYFTGKWGQTIGKMVAGIKVVALDGSPAGFTRAFYRHSVDLALSLLTSALSIYVLMSVVDEEYARLDFEGRLDLLSGKTGGFGELVDWLSIAWVASELVVLLMNEKRRALHDFIAGTVVIHVERSSAAARV